MNLVYDYEPMQATGPSRLDCFRLQLTHREVYDWMARTKSANCRSFMLLRFHEIVISGFRDEPCVVFVEGREISLFSDMMPYTGEGLLLRDVRALTEYHLPLFLHSLLTPK